MTAKQNVVGNEEWLAAGIALAQLDRAMNGYRSLAVDITGFTVRGPAVSGGEFLCVIRGIDEEGKAVVAFHSAFALPALVRGVEGRLVNGTLKWRDDQYAN